MAQPDYFLPYLYLPDTYEGLAFNTLEDICTQFNIPLPALPSQKDYQQKALFYGKLCHTFYEFRESHDLSSAEMCAFLYDFALNIVDEQESSNELPEASNVWLIKGGIGENGDAEFVEKATKDTFVSRWGGTRDIQKGDILLLYLLSPISSIHSIWRAYSDGFVDPFYYFHSAVSIGQMIKTKPVTFQELKNDPVLGQKGLIKANLQGKSGNYFTFEEYEAIKMIMASKRTRYFTSSKIQSVKSS